VVVVQSNDFNQSRIRTVVCAAITTNPRLALAPGNVVLRRRETGLRTVSVANVSQLLTVDKDVLTERLGRLTTKALHQLDEGLRLVLAL
jgi:mRNA interferase MazF